ncbi:pectinesterase inhibitor 9-like [Arachis stenosperma]|uniref:pectinesterase inhibitor 9-like n=1 Tax=Arachis stenosperma TaxID=217475 RepID=UPI0025ACE53E|nr:pectinesterase inhibitor 9-like [Arachis stenosperma]
MAARVVRHGVILVLPLLLASFVTQAGGTTPQDFIKSSCRATRYPAVCVECLMSYAGVIGQSKRQLALAALSVSISRTRSCSSFVKKMAKEMKMKPRELGAVQDCIENMGDSIDRLSQSVREMQRVGEGVGEEFEWHMSNVQTWVSAALTDDNTCLDGFGGRAMNGNVKAAIRGRVLHVAQLTSNALALVNRFASTHTLQTSPILN